jgi:hypothetical protein
VLVVRAKIKEKVKVAAKGAKRAVVAAQVQDRQRNHRTLLLPGTYLQESQAHGRQREKEGVLDPLGRLGCPSKATGSPRSSVSRRTLGKRRPVAVQPLLLRRPQIPLLAVELLLAVRLHHLTL